MKENEEKAQLMAVPQGLSLVNLAAEIKVSKLYQLNCGHLLCHLQYAATRVVTNEKASFFVFTIAVWFGDRREERAFHRPLLRGSDQRASRIDN